MPSNVCAYNKILLDNRRFRIKDLIQNGDSVATETISKYEIHFYNALYNLTPDKLKKFAAPYETETGRKESGTYHKAYSEYARYIGPDSTKNAAISTHIDKEWDSIKSMPELDFNYQQQVIKKIHKAFIYGLIHNAIQQLLAGIFEQRDNQLKVAVVAVIRVGHAGVFTMIR